jgi:hypothetical protein
LGESDGDQADEQGGRGCQEECPLGYYVSGGSGELDDDVDHECRHQSKRDHPDEVGELRLRIVEKGQGRQCVVVRAQPGERADPDEDQGTDPGGDQAGQQHQRQCGTGQTGRLDDDHSVQRNTWIRMAELQAMIWQQ